MKIFDMDLKGKEAEYITKGIAIGVGSGIVIGALLNNVSLFFAIGGTVGVFGSFAFMMYRRVKSYIIEQDTWVTK